MGTNFSQEWTHALTTFEFSHEDIIFPISHHSKAHSWPFKGIQMQCIQLTSMIPMIISNIKPA